MEKEKCRQKMLLAVVQGDDYPETVDDLNRNGFFATVLGVEEHRVSAALDVLRQCAGRRQQMTYSNLSISSGGPNPSIPMMPVQMSVGGVVVFIMDLDDIQKF